MTLFSSRARRVATSLLSVAFLFVSIVAFAQTAHAADGPGPHVALKSGQALTGRFVHTHPVKGFDQPMETVGSFSVAPGQKIVWSIEKPMATTTTITPQELVQSVGTFPLLRIKAQQMPFLAQMQNNLLLALSGDFEKLKTDFDVASSGSDKAWTVVITPREKEGTPKPFQKIVAHGGRFVENADVYLKTVIDHVAFSDQKIVSMAGNVP